MLKLDGIQASAGNFDLKADFTLSGPGRVAVLGPSGAGKSTLLDVIAGFRLPKVGRICLEGLDITGMATADRGVAILFQDNNLFPHLTVSQNLALALRPTGGRLTRQDKAQIAKALSDVDLADLGGRRPSYLSGGQQSRAALARILVQKARVWLLDEPFSALGPGLRAELIARVSHIAQTQGALVVMVTHDPHDAQLFADKVILVTDGKAACPDPAQDFFANPPSAYLDYLGNNRSSLKR